MDLVVSGTGMVGGRVARRLKEMGRQVRAAVRGGAGRPEAAPLTAAGIEVVDADVTRPESLAAACRGVGSVVCGATSVHQPSAESFQRVDLEGVGALVDAAQSAGCRRFVYLSFSGSFTHPSALQRAKRATEQKLLASRLETVILRPSFFMEVWLSPHLGFDPRSGKARLYGSGDSPVSWVSAVDVAEIAAAAAAGKGPVGIAEIGGPEAVSLREVVRRCEQVLGRPIATEAVPLAALEQGVAGGDPVQQTFSALMLVAATGDAIPAAEATAAGFGVTLRPLERHLDSFRPD